MPIRRSLRLQALSADDQRKEGVNFVHEDFAASSNAPKKPKRKRSKPNANLRKQQQKEMDDISLERENKKRKSFDNEFDDDKSKVQCLPRSIEKACQLKFPNVQKVIGIDEAGRGPLAGPVVTAAVWTSIDLNGIIDSKKISKEAHRETLYEQIIQLPNVEWAVAIIDAARIDEINILQATLEGMRSCAQAIIDPSLLKIPIETAPSIDTEGCYVVCSAHKSIGLTQLNRKSRKENDSFYVLIDGNKVPTEMPCLAESVVKGDGKEYMIAAASVLAKVTRDRLMHAYDVKYPDFNLKQNKGYPTKDHMKAVMKFGASPIHRRTFAPLKHMTLNEEGKIIEF